MRTFLAPGTSYTDLPDGGAALVTPNTGEILHLDAVAATFVKALSEHHRDVVTVLAERFEAAPATIAADLDELVTTLTGHGVFTGGRS